MDTEARIKDLDERLTALENVFEETTNRVQHAIVRLKNHPLIGSLVRMIED